MATASARPSKALTQPENVAQLLRRLGNIPAFRVRLEPPPGTATERDLVRHNESKLKTAICELVDGTLVEKAMGWDESAIAIVIATALSNFVGPRKLGTVLGADGMERLFPGLVRVPDVSFFSRGKLSRSKHGSTPHRAGRRRSHSRSRQQEQHQARDCAQAHGSISPPAAGWPGWSSRSRRRSECTRHPKSLSFSAWKIGLMAGACCRDSALRYAMCSNPKNDTSLRSATLMQPSLFAEHDRPEQAARLAPMLKALAAQGIYFGTSSWKYEGWLGSIYTPERYMTRGKFSRRKFEDECLAEYAETFPAVGGDFSFYQFPAPEYWQTAV